MQKSRLMTPGPSPVPEDTLLDLARPMVHHRTAEFRETLARVLEDLQYVFQTRNDVILLTSSGTGAMEAAVVNTVAAGQKAIVLNAGRFAQRWIEIGQAYGIQTVSLDVPWGQAVNADDLAGLLRRHPDAQAVLGTLSETSTGVGHDIEVIGKVVAETDAILIVDGISGVGAMECRTDDWSVDLLCVGSQKALMLPPGLAFVSVSPKAWAKAERFKPPAFYFNLTMARKKLATPETPFTPAHTLVHALGVSLERIRREGIEAVWARHRRMSEACRAGIEALGLELFATRPAEGLTAVKVPDGIEAAQLSGRLKEKFGITVAGGQDKLKGKIFRIAHMGYMDELDVISGLAALELVLQELGYDLEPGRGVAAAQQVFAGQQASAGRAGHDRARRPRGARP